MTQHLGKKKEEKEAEQERHWQQSEHVLDTKTSTDLCAWRSLTLMSFISHQGGLKWRDIRCRSGTRGPFAIAVWWSLVRVGYLYFKALLSNSVQASHCRLITIAWTRTVSIDLLSQKKKKEPPLTRWKRYKITISATWPLCNNEGRKLCTSEMMNVNVKRSRCAF